MRPYQPDQIAVHADGEVGVLGEHMTGKVGAFAGRLVTACPVAVAREIADSIAPAAVRSAKGGLQLSDLGLYALSEGGAEVAEEIISATEEIARIAEAEAAARIKAEEERARTLGRSIR